MVGSTDALKKLEELRTSGAKIRIADIQEVLSASPEWWHVIFDQAGLAMAVADMEGNVLAISPSMQTVFGYSEEEINSIGGILGMTHPEDRALDAGLFAELLRGERDHYQLEKRYYRKDGSLMWGRLTVLILRAGNGEPSFPVGIVQDITETKDAEDALEAARIASLKHEQALAINDNVVQGLVVAKMALEGGLEEKALETLAATLEKARATVKELMGDRPEPPGGLLR